MGVMMAGVEVALWGIFCKKSTGFEMVRKKGGEEGRNGKSGKFTPPSPRKLQEHRW